MLYSLFLFRSRSSASPAESRPASGERLSPPPPSLPSDEVDPHAKLISIHPPVNVSRRRPTPKPACLRRRFIVHAPIPEYANGQSSGWRVDSRSVAARSPCRLLPSPAPPSEPSPPPDANDSVSAERAPQPGTGPMAAMHRSRLHGMLLARIKVCDPAPLGARAASRRPRSSHPPSWPRRSAPDP
jgi:hypothetical protein